MTFVAVCIHSCAKFAFNFCHIIIIICHPIDSMYIFSTFYKRSIYMLCCNFRERSTEWRQSARALSRRHQPLCHGLHRVHHVAEALDDGIRLSVPQIKTQSHRAQLELHASVGRVRERVGRKRSWWSSSKVKVITGVIDVDAIVKQ